jgi:hypothetical protein
MSHQNTTTETAETPLDIDTAAYSQQEEEGAAAAVAAVAPYWQEPYYPPLDFEEETTTVATTTANASTTTTTTTEDGHANVWDSDRTIPLMGHPVYDVVGGKRAYPLEIRRLYDQIHKLRVMIHNQTEITPTHPTHHSSSSRKDGWAMNTFLETLFSEVVETERMFLADFVHPIEEQTKRQIRMRSSSPFSNSEC